MKTSEQVAEQIADEVADRAHIGAYTNSRSLGGRGFRKAIALAAIEADRAQRAIGYAEYHDVCEVVDRVKLDDRLEDTDHYAGAILAALGLKLDPRS